MVVLYWSHPAACEQMRGKITAAFQTADLALASHYAFYPKMQFFTSPHIGGKKYWLAAQGIPD